MLNDFLIICCLYIFNLLLIVNICFDQLVSTNINNITISLLGILLMKQNGLIKKFHHKTNKIPNKVLRAA